MTGKYVCAKCGAEVLSDSPENLCVKCLLIAGIWPEDDIFPESEPPGQPAFHPTTIGSGDKVRYFGDYELLEEIGRGGMGMVYRARQTSLQRVVALKMILSGQLASESEVRRFRTETEALAHLDHPNVVAIYEVGKHEGLCFFSMQFVEGTNLAKIIKINKTGEEKCLKGTLPLQSLRSITAFMVKVARAVHYVHQRGILHRDLKPSNILVDQNGEPHITDFGLARQLGVQDSLTLTGAVIGTPNYMAPEQAAGRAKQLTTSADVYSLGAILYQLITGCAPFNSDTPLETLRSVMEQEVVRPHILNSMVDRDLETICLRCMEKEPKYRYGSAEALADDLERWLRMEPIQARQINAYELALKWIRRKPAIAGLTAVAFALMIMGFIGILGQWRRAENHAKQEAQQRLRSDGLLNQMRLNKAEEYFSADKSGAALAYCSLILRQNPSHQVAAERTMSALMYRNFALPASEPFEADRIMLVRNTAEGLRVVTYAATNTVRVWDIVKRHAVVIPLPGASEAIDLSNDGLWLATVWGQTNIQVWDARTGQMLTPVFDYQPATVRDPSRSDNTSDQTERAPLRITSVSFSPNGQQVVTTATDHSARVWNSTSGRLMAELPLWHDSILWPVWFSPDNRYLLTCTLNAAWIWDMAASRFVMSPLQPPQGVAGGQFSPNGRHIVSYSYGNPIYAYTWEIPSGQLLGTPIKHLGTVLSCEFSPDGEQAVIACADSTARIWEVLTGNMVTSPLKHEEPLTCAVFNHDGKYILTGSYDMTARIWDSKQGSPITESMSHLGIVKSTFFTSNQDRIATVCGEPGQHQMTSSKRLQVWDITTRTAQPQALLHPGRVIIAKWNLDGSRIATVCEDNTVRIWHVKTRQQIAPTMQHKDQINSLEFSSDGRWLATSSADKTARIWDANSGMGVIPPLQHESEVLDARFSPNGQLLATICAGSESWNAKSGQAVKIWNIRTGQERMPQFTYPDGLHICKLLFSPDGKRLIVTGSGWTQVWDIQKYQALSRLVRPKLTPSTSIVAFEQHRPALSLDGQRVITAIKEDTAIVWDVSSGQVLLPMLRHQHRISHAAFSPNGQYVVTASWDKTAQVWDAHTGQPLGEPLKHASFVDWADFSLDSKRVVTASNDKRLRVWDTVTGQPITEPLQVKEVHTQATFSPDGRWLLTEHKNHFSTFKPPLESDAAMMWELPKADEPVPSWLPKLAEAIGGFRLSDRGILEPVPTEVILHLRDRILKETPTNNYTSWGKWLFSDPPHRTVSPLSTVTQASLSENESNITTTHSE